MEIDIKSHTQFEEEYEFIEVTEEEMPDDEAAETVTDVNEDEEIVEIPEEASDDE